MDKVGVVGREVRWGEFAVWYHSGYVKCVTRSNYISSFILIIQWVRKFDRLSGVLMKC